MGWGWGRRMQSQPGLYSKTVSIKPKVIGRSRGLWEEEAAPRGAQAVELSSSLTPMAVLSCTE
jgi:hypothetical protein